MGNRLQEQLRIRNWYTTQATYTLPWADRTQYTHRSNDCFKTFTIFRSIPSSVVLHFLLQDAVSAKTLKSLKVPTLKVSEVYISGESIM